MTAAPTSALTGWVPSAFTGGGLRYDCYEKGSGPGEFLQPHALALARAGLPATYVVSAPTPFRREDCDDLWSDAAQAIERRHPGLLALMAERGWHPPSSIDRVYDSSLAVRELGFRPRFGIHSCLAGDWDPLPSP